LPDTRPGLVIEEDGVCIACKFHASRPTIDWDARKLLFQQVVENARARSAGYDCLIPVSGGKDSIWQTATCLEHGLKPLCVTWKPPLRTDLGRHNLNCLVNLGVDHIDYQISPAVEKKFLLKALERFGAPGAPMHMAIFSISLRLAVQFDIPLIVWGENSAFEYGGAKEESTGFAMTDAWLEKHGVTHGTTAEDWVGPELSRKDLTPYYRPAIQELKGISAVFLGYYFPWDPTTSLLAAKKAGFRVREEGPRLGLYNYADIDDYFISVHHWLKWYKFGITRLFDNLSLEIRNGRMTRQQAIETLHSMGEQRPKSDIDMFCEFVGISREYFFQTAEKFRNVDIWKKRGHTWVIEDFLIPDWAWD